MRTNLLQRLLVTILLLLAAAAAPATAANHSDLWWNPAESGRGLIVIDHGSDIFAVWCTYTDSGLATWFVIPGGHLSTDGAIFEGDFYQTLSNGDDNRASIVTVLGTARIDFAPPDLPPGSARFSVHYSMPGPVDQETHDLARQPFGTRPPAWGSDLTDIWFDPAEPGWAIATIQHGESDLFGVMLLYNYDGVPLFFVFPSRATGGGRFEGPMYLPRAPVHPPVAGLHVASEPYGTASLAFSASASGPAATLLFSATPFMEERTLVRQPFGRPLPSY